MSTVEKERRKNAKLSTGAYDKRRAEVAEMSVVKIRQELKGHKVEEWNGDDGGLLKAKVFLSPPTFLPFQKRLEIGNCLSRI